MNDIRIALRAERGAFRLELDLTLKARGVTALHGASGSGKTSALRLIAGLDRGQGQLWAFGECWQDSARGVFLPTHRRAVGYVFQEPSLFPHLSVRQNLAFAEKRARGPAPRLDAIVAQLDLQDLLARPAERLSGGERQRVAIGRALLAGPRLLLMDEPLSALDAARKAELLPYLERLRTEAALPIIYVSHALDEVLRLADEFVILQAGRALAAGPIDEVLARLEAPFSGDDPASSILTARVGQHADGEGLTRLDFDGGSLWVNRLQRPAGAAARVRVLARDVALSAQHPGLSSILNVLPARVLELAEAGPHRVLVRLAAGGSGSALLALVTRRSSLALGLAPGVHVHALMKSVALIA
jgi:molybdate transport system ATP-binding protein